MDTSLRASASRPLRRLKDRSGSSAVEFALIAPILLLILFGTIRAGHALGVQHSLSQLAADAARHVLPEPVSGRRVDLARRFVLSTAPTYPLLGIGAMDCVVEETDGVLAVRVSIDVSRIPDIPLVAAAYAFPKVQSATAAVVLQP